MTAFGEGDWAYSTEHREVARIVEVRDIWGHTAYRIWLPARLVEQRTPGIIGEIGLAHRVGGRSRAPSATPSALTLKCVF